MKTLKYLLSAAMVAAITTSCNDDDYIDETSSSELPESIYEFSAAELEKMAYGCEYYLDEDTTLKTETRATEKYLTHLRCQMDSMEQASVKISHLKSAGVDRVGVLKETTCGRYPELIIRYDCEDNKPRPSLSDYANDIATIIDRNKNMIFHFCVVPASMFGSIGEEYAVLRLSTDTRANKGHFTYHLDLLMDAEERNTNTTVFFGENAPNVGITYFFKPNSISYKGDLSLSFERYTAEYKDVQLPNFGFNYGVFGTLKNCDHGKIVTDDEDRNNSNMLIEYTYKTDGSKMSESVIGDENCYNIFWVGKNTNMFISKIESK